MSGVAARRMRNMRLADVPASDPAAVVRDLGAVQAQDFGGAKWALAQRCPATTDAEVTAAFNAGRILRTHVLRPTWHFVTPGDIRWMLQLTGPRVLAGSAGRQRQLGLDNGHFRRAHVVLEQGLEGGVSLTRGELAGLFVAAGIDPEGQRLPHLLMHAELTGLICSGPMKGKQHTYALLEDRVPPAGSRDEDSALAELAARYFTSHGPAQLADFTWWSGLTVAPARRGIEGAGPALRHEVIDGVAHWGPSSPPRIGNGQLPVRLLPNYDEYVVAYRHRRAYYDAALDPLLFRGGVMANVVIVDGRALGNWGRQVKRAEVVVTVHPWVALSPQTLAGLEAAVADYGRFLGLPARLLLEP